MKWTKIDGAGDLPPPRSHFASGVLNGKLYVFGGSGKGEHEKLNDLYALDLCSLKSLCVGDYLVLWC
jgi:N-acetylneuraminic acid mutarotase